MSDLNVDLYWSFRSPFSYIILPEMKRLITAYRVHVTVKPVYPLIIRVPDYFQKADPRFFSYLLRDAERTAQMQSIPFAKPEPDPIVMHQETRMAAPEQPYIYRLNRIAAAASLISDILPLVDEISHLIWSGQVQDWHAGSHLQDAIQRAGYDLATLDHQAHTQPKALDAQLAQNQKDLESAGHWGVPTLIFKGEPFFGHDRVSHLIWRMQQHGLQAR
ncbi:MAG: DsbA family protein [Pseudomonadota bacterium]